MPSQQQTGQEKQEAATTRKGWEPAEQAVVDPATDVGQVQLATQRAGAVQPAEILQMQRLVGNRAVSQVLSASRQERVAGGSALTIQARLRVGPVGDAYEQEADRISKEIVSKTHPPVSQQPSGGQTVQRQEEEEELQMAPLQRQEEEEELQMASLQRQEEEEELQMAPLQRQEEEEELQMAPLQRQEEEEELQATPAPGIQRLPGGAGQAATPELERSIQQARNGGQSLSDDVRGPMEQAFDADFGGVKVHTDALAGTLNRSLQSKAFTAGRDIFFGSGQYKPGSSSSQQLLAHELTHTIQQGASQRMATGRGDKATKHNPQAASMARVRRRGSLDLQSANVSSAKPGANVIQRNLSDWLAAPFNPGRRRERILARKTFKNADVQRALRTCLNLLSMKYSEVEEELTEETKGKKYTPQKEGRYTKVSLKDKLSEMMGKLLKGTPTDTSFYQDVAAVFADAAKVFQYHIKRKVQEQKREGFFFNIIGKADKMRKVLNKGPILTAYRKSNSIYKRAERFNQCRGPSSTTLATLNLANFVGCGKEQQRAIAWGLFAWWRTKNRPFHTYHTFKETMMILNSYLGEELFETLPPAPLIKDREESGSKQEFLA